MRRQIFLADCMQSRQAGFMQCFPNNIARLRYFPSYLVLLLFFQPFNAKIALALSIFLKKEKRLFSKTDCLLVDFFRFFHNFQWCVFGKGSCFSFYHIFTPFHWIINQHFLPPFCATFYTFLLFFSFLSQCNPRTTSRAL